MSRQPRFDIRPFRDLPWLAGRVRMLRAAAAAVLLLGVAATLTPARPWVALAGGVVAAALNLAAAWGLASARLTITDEALIARSRFRRVHVPFDTTARIDVSWRSSRGVGPAVVAVDTAGQQHVLPTDAIAGLAHIRGRRWRRELETVFHEVCTAHDVELSVQRPRWAAVLPSTPGSVPSD